MMQLLITGLEAGFVLRTLSSFSSQNRQYQRNLKKSPNLFLLFFSSLWDLSCPSAGGRTEDQMSFIAESFPFVPIVLALSCAHALSLSLPCPTAYQIGKTPSISFTGVEWRNISGKI